MNIPSKHITALSAMMIILQDLGLEETPNVGKTNLFLRWIFNALLELRANVLFNLSESRITIENCVAKKPCGYFSLVDAFIEVNGSLFPCVKPRQKSLSQPDSVSLINNVSMTGTQNGLPPGANYTVPVSSSADQNQDNLNPANSIANNLLLNFEMEEDVFYFRFSQNANSKTLFLRFKEFSFHEEGMPMVDVRYMEAITSYCKYKWIERCRINGDVQYAESQLQTAKEDWHKTKRMNRSLAMLDSMNRDLLNQISAQFFDPLYVNQNPYFNLEKRLNNIILYNGVTKSLR